jgi:hypothetical protein
MRGTIIQRRGEDRVKSRQNGETPAPSNPSFNAIDALW